MLSNGAHWDAIFSKHEDKALGWYEESADQTLKMLDPIPDWKRSSVFLPGAGTSVLIDELLSRGCKRLVLNDISREALRKVRERLDGYGENLVSLCRDVAQPLPASLAPVDIWIDRAVLHFLTDEDNIRGYFENVFSLTKPGGHALFAEFSKVGAERCAGLPVHRYSVEELSKRLGPAFTLVSQTNHTYINPGGDPRPYVYALFQRSE